jgi:ankyrin repeat protein
VVRAFDRLGLLDILQTQDGDRGLQVALWAGLPDIAERLLNEGVDVVSFATFGKPPLLVAGIAGLKAISIRLRVLQPSSWSRRDRSQADVDMYSVMAQGDDVLLNWLRNGGDPNTLVRGTSALSLALANGRERSAALLLAFGATIEDFDDEGFPPLARAADMGSIGLVRLFLWHGCDPNQAGRDLRYNSIPVLGAVRQEDTQVLEALIEAGADINARSRGGETALTLSAIRGNNAAIEVLARNGVDLRVATSDGWGAMHWAVLGGREVGKRERTIRLLARIGVDLNLQDRNGRNALDFAMSKNEFEVAAVLRDLGLGDAYSVPERWKRRVVAGKFDYFVSYRWHRFGDAARSLAARLREAGCEVFLDATEPVLREYQEADPPRQIPLQKLRRTLFLAAQSSLCTLFFESTLDAAVDPRAGTTVTNFSWQLFERFYSRAWVLLRSSQDDDDVRNFVAAAKVRREYFHSGAE